MPEPLGRREKRRSGSESVIVVFGKEEGTWIRHRLQWEVMLNCDDVVGSDVEAFGEGEVEGTWIRCRLLWEATPNLDDAVGSDVGAFREEGEAEEGTQICRRPPWEATLNLDDAMGSDAGAFGEEGEAEEGTRICRCLPWEAMPKRVAVLRLRVDAMGSDAKPQPRHGKRCRSFRRGGRREKCRGPGSVVTFGRKGGDPDPSSSCSGEAEEGTRGLAPVPRLDSSLGQDGTTGMASIPASPKTLHSRKTLGSNLLAELGLQCFFP